MFQILMTLFTYIVLVAPVGIYLYYVTTKQKTFADPIFGRIGNRIYRVCRIKRGNMSWRIYALNLSVTDTVMVLIGYLVLRLQRLLFPNPNKIGAMEPTLPYNTIISFMIDTNLQHYSDESGLTYLSQMVVIIFMMLTSAATGYTACMAFCRGMSGRPMGNLYEDMVRNIARILIPIAFIVRLILIWQGTLQNLQSNFTVHTMGGKPRGTVTGSIVALESIRHVGTNGDGLLGANSSISLKNPTIVSNIAELYSMMILPDVYMITFGRMIADKHRELRERTVFGEQGRTVSAAVAIIFMAGLAICYTPERAGNSILTDVGLNQDMESYEGKEARSGIAQSALFATATVSFTTGTANDIHDTLMPLGGLVPLLHVMLNCVFGRKGVGLMNMVMCVILTVFINGLMIGHTPEYLGRKIKGREVKLVAVCFIIHSLLVPDLSALAIPTAGGFEGIINPGFHGLFQVLYEYSSSAANNGSGFEGLANDSVFQNMAASLAIYFGYFPAIMLQLAIAGSIPAKRKINEAIGTLRTDDVMLTLIPAFAVYMFAVLALFLALALGPIAEHLIVWFLVIG